MTPAAADARRASLDRAFWITAAALLALRLVLTSDLSVQITYSPHDDSMYVERAFYFLNGAGFGPYDSQILVKYPGISLWLALMRWLGIPFLLSVNALYVGAGVYLLMGLRRAGTSRGILLGAFALYLFNPISYGYEWIRVLREPLGTGFLVLMAGTVLHMLLGAARGATPWRHLIVFALAFAFSLYLREDDRLLWGLLGLVVAALALALRQRMPSRGAMVVLGAAVLAPAALGLGYEAFLRIFVEAHYGAPIIHELGEGEYPKLLAAIRSIESKKDNRMVMVTQEALRKLRVEVPMLAPVIDRLPPPGRGTFSCRIQGVCSEWSNGWMPFWIKDAAYRAGLTPDAAATQDVFRRARDAIEQACATQRLRCTPNGDGLVPPFELRWTRALVAEAWRLAKTAFAPQPFAVGISPVIYEVPVEVGRMFQTVTMTDYLDTERQTATARPPAARAYESPFAQLRPKLMLPYQMLAGVLVLAALAALALRLWLADRVPLGPVCVTATVFVIYLLVRFAALSYVAVYMGPFDPRMMFSTYALAVVLALPVLADALNAARGRNG